MFSEVFGMGITIQWVGSWMRDGSGPAEPTLFFIQLICYPELPEGMGRTHLLQAAEERKIEKAQSLHLFC